MAVEGEHVPIDQWTSGGMTTTGGVGGTQRTMNRPLHSSLRDGEDDEEDFIEILPDVIKGWLLLEKAGPHGEESRHVPHTDR